MLDDEFKYLSIRLNVALACLFLSSSYNSVPFNLIFSFKAILPVSTGKSSSIKQTSISFLPSTTCQNNGAKTLPFGNELSCTTKYLHD